MVESSDVISIKCAKCHRRRHPFILRAHNILCRVEGNCRPPSDTPTHRLQYDVNFYTVFPRILSYPLSTSPIHSGGRKDRWWRWTRRKPRCFGSWTKAHNHTVTQIRPSNPESAWVGGCVSWAVSIVIILFYFYFRTKVLDVLIQLNLVVGDLLHWRHTFMSSAVRPTCWYQWKAAGSQSVRQRGSILHHHSETGTSCLDWREWDGKHGLIGDNGDEARTQCHATEGF